MQSRMLPSPNSTKAQNLIATSQSSHQTIFDQVKTLCEQGQLYRAIQVVRDGNWKGCGPSTDIFYQLLQSCFHTKDVNAGRNVHRIIIDFGIGIAHNAFLGSHLIRMFALCGCLTDAHHVFNEVVGPTVFTWNALISAYTTHGLAADAIIVYSDMCSTHLKPDQHIFVSALKACSKAELLAEGKMIHSHIIINIPTYNTYVGNTLIDLYIGCHSLDEARNVFDRMLSRDVVTWSATILGYSENGHCLEALALFRQMQLEGVAANIVTYVGVLKSCSDRMTVDQGMFVHACIANDKFITDLILCNTLVAMYAKRGQLRQADMIFKQLPNRDIITWNVLIAGFSDQGCHSEAVCLFQDLLKEGTVPDDVTVIGVLKAISGLGALEEGKLLHFFAVNNELDLGLFVNNTLIDMYGKCGSVNDAQAVFSKLARRDLVTWNTLIAGYVNHSYDIDALNVFQEMASSDINPDSVTFVSILQACSSLRDLAYGKLIHAFIVSGCIEMNVCLYCSLIYMYKNCKSCEDAEYMSNILAYLNKELKPLHILDIATLDDNELINMLKTCSILTALDVGRLLHMHIIETVFQLHVSISNPLIDMYAKCGSLEDAFSVFEKMTIRDVVTWTTMISVYGQHGSYEHAVSIFQQMQKEGVRPSEITYVCLLTLCSRAGLVQDGCLHFKSIMESHGLEPRVDHYYCMVDLFGRTGRLAEAEDVLETLPYLGPEAIGLRTFLNHCKLHGDVELGLRHLESY